jgi:predicted phosphodiesterase
MDPVPSAGTPDPVADWRDAVAHASPPPELTTVGPDFAVIHEGAEIRRYDGLEPDSVHDVEGFAFRTLPQPGALLTTFAAVNDVHFGEEVCGLVHGSDVGPTFRSLPGEDPYPEVMNQAVVEEIERIDPAAVLVKGDLTSNGTREEYETFLATYEPRFGDRLHVIRGNHESYNRSPFARESFHRVDLPGVTLVMIDTSIDGEPAGTVRPEQIDQLEEVGAAADRPVMVFGHHHVGDRLSPERADRTFGIDVEASEALVAAVARHPAICGYFSGHTHRNRVRRFPLTGDVPWVEVACVKDFPGGWAEYRVHEGGILQIFHRISGADALVWSERTRHMYEGLYEDYAFGALSDRCFVIPTRASPG